jgi:transcriptional regulator with XRE-family HTH domain
MEIKFGSYVRELRKQKDLSLRQLAEDAGIDFAYLSKVETNKIPPPSEKAITRLASALGADVDELLALGGKFDTDLHDFVVSEPRAPKLLRAWKEGRIEDVKKIIEQSQEAPGHKQYAMGSISGWLDKINIHRDENVFNIYPIVGPAKGVPCKFGKALEHEAVQAVSKFVDVWGRLEYNPVDSFPQEVNVHKIEVRPDRDGLPKLADLRGVAPEATGEKLSEDFIGDLRDDWG